MDKPLCFQREKKTNLDTHLGSDFLVVACCVWEDPAVSNIHDLLLQIPDSNIRYSSRLFKIHSEVHGTKQCMRHRDTKEGKSSQLGYLHRQAAKPIRILLAKLYENISSTIISLLYQYFTKKPRFP